MSRYNNLRKTWHYTNEFKVKSVCTSFAPHSLVVRLQKPTHHQRGNMPLIKQVYEAAENGSLSQPFTVQYLKQWMGEHHVVKDDGDEYAESSIDAILSNSDTKNAPTMNKNIKVLKSRINEDAKHEYLF